MACQTPSKQPGVQRARCKLSGKALWNFDQCLAVSLREEINARMHRMRNLSLALAALLLSVSVAAAQNAPAPRIDGEGINMDAAPPLTKEPHHPADLLAPNAELS